jgi:hypothetical protein
MTADALGESCTAIATWLPVAQALTTEPDISGVTAHGAPSSRPPWNSAAGNAAMDAHEGLRRLEAALRLAVTGRPGVRRGGSDANTAAAIDAIENLGQAVTVQAMAAAARILDRWVRQIQELPAVDEAEPWRKVAAACPYCRFPMLRVRPRSGEVTCLRYGACSDGDGQHPVGRLDVSVLSGDPLIRWADGLVT